MMKRIVILLLICLSNSWLFADHWTPNDSGYEDNMTLTGVICLNGVEQQSTILEVGVFCGEECRGSGLPTYFYPTQRYVVQLLVFGETGDQLTFKLYDHALGQEIDMVSQDTVFNANGYGSLSNPYVIDFVGATLPFYSITASANPIEGGTIEGAGDYQEGQSCTLTAMANEGYTFTNWTENGNVVSTDASYTFIVNADRTLVANFTINSYTITATVNPNAGGTVSGGGNYNHGSSCTLTATANQGYTFTNWTENGVVVSTNDSYSFTVNANRTLVANFTVNTYTISVTANPVEGGTIQGTGDYQEGQTCTLVATANEGYAFSNWTENDMVVSTNSTYAFSVISDRALIANFIVTGGDTHWVPNEQEYEDNMTLTGVIQINDIEQQSTTLEVGVFCGEECRGVGMPTYFFPTQRYVIQLLIFGEIGDQLTFKLYDHELGQELNLTSPEAITFVANGYGSLGNPFVLSFIGESSEISQTIPLSAGWNWCSFNVDITLDDLKATLVEALPGTSITIKGKDAATTYNGIRWRGQLTTLEVTQMYRISVSADCEITIEGTSINPAEHPVTISNGANWIGFPFRESMSLSDAFAGFAVSGDVVKSKGNGIATYNGTTWRGTLETLVPGQGYIYNSAATGTRTFTFPTSTK